MRNRIIVAIILIVSLLLGFWLVFGRAAGPPADEPSMMSEDSPLPAAPSSVEMVEAPLNFDHVWKKTTIDYDPECSDNCIELLERPAGAHGGSVRLVVNPEIDDPVAQWGDCVGSIMACYENGIDSDSTPLHRDETMHTCILESACPAECRNHYSLDVNDDMMRVNAALESTFLGERASCLPTEAWVE